MAHTKAQGSVRGNRDSIAKRLGVKLFGGQLAKAGSIIIRQKGSKFFPGINALMGKDFTIFAKTAGTVFFKTLKGRKLIDIVTK